MEENHREETLMQSADIVNTSYDVTPVQNKLFYYCLFVAQREKNGKLYSVIKSSHFYKFIKNKADKNVKGIKKELDKISKTELIFSRNENTIDCHYTLIVGYEYNKITDEFTIFFFERLYRHIIEYSICAPLNLNVLNKYRSFYAQRLYVLLRLWSEYNKTVDKEFSIEELRFLTSTLNKYPFYNNFKERVIKPSVKEINKVGTMEVTFSEIKVNKKVERILFEFKDKEFKQNNSSKSLEDSGIEITINDIIDRLNLGEISINISLISKLLNDYGAKLLLKGIDILVKKNYEIQVTNPYAYLNGILKKLSLKENKNEDDQDILNGFNNFQPRRYINSDILHDVLSDNTSKLTDEEIRELLKCR